MESVFYSEEAREEQALKPGMTGWAQVNGRNAISWEEKFALDLWYVDRQSWRLDLRILAGTVLHMLGLPFALMRTLRIVPTPMAREIAAPMPETTLAPRKQAA